jgi:hypothetical protein
MLPALAFAAPHFAHVARLGVEAGLAAAAILDGNGDALAVAGALDADEARAVAAFVTNQARSENLRARLHAGELLDGNFGERDVRVGIAAECVFIVVVLPNEPAAVSLTAIDDLRRDIEAIVGGIRRQVAGFVPPSSPPPPPTGSSGSGGSGPAELPVVEYGVTVPRRGPAN